ncbi:MAG TPA: hypothetical protein VHO01_07410 [Jatrophihabitans sp.]|nr:hypothetical protein [Jatrophihabitans sp.]
MTVVTTRRRDQVPAPRRFVPRLRALAAGHAELIWAAIALIATLLVTRYRWQYAHKARYPGHADPAFYYNVAQNIHAAKGQTINYVWHFLVPQDHLTHYAFDYWLPLPSWLMALGLESGGGLTAAIDVAILLTVLLCAAVYALLRELTHSSWAPALGAVVVLVQPGTSRYAMQTESTIYLAAFGLCAVAAAVYARRIAWMWVPAGAFTALATLSRSEGLLLSIAMGLSALAWTRHSRWYLRFGLLLAGYLPAMAYFFVENLRHFRTLFPPASAAFPYITSYEELFATHVPKSLSLILGGRGLHYYVSTRERAFSALPSIMTQLITPGSFVLLLVLFGAFLGRVRPATDRWDSSQAAPDSHVRRRWLAPVYRAYRHPSVQAVLQSAWLLPGTFALLSVLLDGQLAPLVAAGATLKSFVTIGTLLIVVAMAGLVRIRPHWWLIVIVAVILVIGPLPTLKQQTESVVSYNNQVGQGVVGYTSKLQAEQACLHRPVVLMTRQPWEISQATGFPTVQLPAGSLQDIMAIVRKYGVTDVLDPGIRPAFADLAAMTGPDGPLTTTATLPGGHFYRFKETTQGASC